MARFVNQVRNFFPTFPPLPYTTRRKISRTHHFLDVHARSYLVFPKRRNFSFFNTAFIPQKRDQLLVFYRPTHIQVYPSTSQSLTCFPMTSTQFFFKPMSYSNSLHPDLSYHISTFSSFFILPTCSYTILIYYPLYIRSLF